MPVFIEPNDHPVRDGWSEFDRRWYGGASHNLHKQHCMPLSKMLRIKL